MQGRSQLGKGGKVWVGSAARNAEGESSPLAVGSLRVSGGSAATSAEAQAKAHAAAQESRGFDSRRAVTSPGLNLGPRDRRRIFTPRPVAAALVETTNEAIYPPTIANPDSSQVSPAAQHSSAALVPLGAITSPVVNIQVSSTQVVPEPASEVSAASSRIASIFRSFFGVGGRKQDAAD